MPLVVIIFLAIPVGAARFLVMRAVAKKNRIAAEQGPTEKDGTEELGNDAEKMGDPAEQARRNYEKTVDFFWNNLMFWLFVTYPGTRYVFVMQKNNFSHFHIDECFDVTISRR